MASSSLRSQCERDTEQDFNPLFKWSSSSSGVLSLVNGPNTQEFNKSDKTTVYKLIIPLCAGPVFRADAVFVSILSMCWRAKLASPRKDARMLAAESDEAKIASGGRLGSSSRFICEWPTCFHFTLSNSITSTPFAHREMFPIKENWSAAAPLRISWLFSSETGSSHMNWKIKDYYYFLRISTNWKWEFW